MKFEDILEDRRRDAEPYTDVQLDIINRANKWTNRTDFRNNDPELYRYLKQFKVIGESDLKLMNLI